MAEPAEYGLTATDLKVLRWVVAQVRSGQFQTDQGSQRRPPWGVFRVKTNGSHGPGVTQAVDLCDSSWTAISGETPDATNESQVTISSGTRCYAVPGGDESLLLITAFICADAP